MPDAPPKYPEVAEFVQLLMARQGVENVAELADALKLDVNERRQLYKYAAGANRPTFTKLMPLLEAAGMLSGETNGGGVDLRRARRAAERLAAEAQALADELVSPEERASDG